MSESKPSLIYLDDEEINLILFREMFKNDFDIFTTTSPHDAIDYVKSNNLDFILTDQLMPIMTGVEFLKELRDGEVAPDSMKVIISGFTQEGEVDSALETKLIDSFVSKPWSYQNLKELLLSRV
ncbi:Response regulator receiver domain-containing protein [Ekhidna lutea]|uniref:Response regulator receiver domain-containing protein n=1 Tax=Ekhidna lutea TaxID=447679 RepID=A0A239MDB1_EKHLU|nr:response regulator [Ekhidna lutea]SNT40044.1 Response regulator receiver domain-containing protein [Ekhidna lutea]